MTTYLITVAVPADLSDEAYAQVEFDTPGRFSMIIIDRKNHVINRVAFDRPQHDHIVVFATEADEALKQLFREDEIPLQVDSDYGIHCQKLCDFLDAHRLAYVDRDGKMSTTITVHRGDSNRVQ